MAKVCDKCGRGPRSSNKRSHSKIATKRKQYLNLQQKTVDGKKTTLCTKCIKSLAKNR
ncbi:MAG TPA: L28 family ribosomal protein [Patescibacteria group bacterium]|nr:L28 family ribosomal protein [Patescibacteria group bacterium]